MSYQHQGEKEKLLMIQQNPAVRMISLSNNLSFRQLIRMLMKHHLTLYLTKNRINLMNQYCLIYLTTVMQNCLFQNQFRKEVLEFVKGQHDLMTMLRETYIYSLFCLWTMYIYFLFSLGGVG